MFIGGHDANVKNSASLEENGGNLKNNWKLRNVGSRKTIKK